MTKHDKIPFLDKLTFDSNHILIQLPSIRRIPGLCRILNIGKLHKRIIPLHINPQQLSKFTKQHFQILPLGRFFREVDDEKRFIGLNIFPPIVFFALDASVSTSKFDAKGS
jgi:hypothetical protein